MIKCAFTSFLISLSTTGYVAMIIINITRNIVIIFQIVNCSSLT
ncbi:hypothetical protein PROSTU_00928 [Providencia stuartii ATCC 25827]|uniref:Uncharacterized protein n=1 Tax=Providencia stuartii ATCC 25827 TaxID=471874 RepID=A0AA87CSK7_PROST|nr:hypothetical protein PROSTU_00928 [Providencia stuartii ATCC 25827]